MFQAVSRKFYDFSIVAGEIIQITYGTHQVHAKKRSPGTKILQEQKKKMKEEKKIVFQPKRKTPGKRNHNGSRNLRFLLCC